ncbi:O-antigen ligase family protein [Rhodobacterales bacterium HKCCE2091]|nr:O-antigen ligase family protein [Rhodobacterales bacterium HKCCE2091]
MTARAESFGRIGLSLSTVETWCAGAALVSVAVEPVIGAAAALAFLLSGMMLMAARPATVVSELLRAWPILALPVFATISFVWSDVPSASLRYGLQLTITFAIAILVARRLPPGQFLGIAVATLGVVMVLSVFTGAYRADGGALTGYYSSKNAMGSAAALFTVLAVGVAVGAGQSPGRRIGLGLAAAFGVLAVLLAQSMSAVLSLSMGVAALVAVALLRPLSPRARVVAALFCLLFAVYACILVTANAEAIAGFVLDATGKDVTLTGRTDLWAIARDLIAERPVLGIGYQAFWVHGNPAAEELWYIFGIESRSGFHFHNTYLSNAVEIGLAGLALQVVLLAGVGWRSGRLALSGADGMSPVLFAVSVMVLAITPIEVPVFFQFNLQTLMLVAILVYATDGLRARRG